MFNIFNELALIAINVNLFLDDNDAQFEKNEFKKDIVNSIDIENNNYFIAV